MASTYVGSIDYSEGDNVFTNPVAQLMPDEGTESNGLPTFVATVTGITDIDPYFHLDFSASHSIVWDIECYTK